MKKWIIFLLVLISQNLYAQYSMSNATVYDCEGTLTDSEANAVNSGWYDHNENFLFTICPNGALSTTINFTFFETEPGNDYVIIYDGPDNTYPIIGGPYSGMTLPPQIVSNGCVTIGFVSDVNVAAPGFELNWRSDVTTPSAPVISLSNPPSCSTNVLTIQLEFQFLKRMVLVLSIVLMILPILYSLICCQALMKVEFTLFTLNLFLKMIAIVFGFFQHHISL